MARQSTSRSSAEDAAREYAWKWFEYHATQRQSVFRFYLLVAGALSTAYVAAANSTQPRISAYAHLFGLLLAIFSFFFWRLDVRSYRLNKIAERYLKREESRLAKSLDTKEVEEIRLFHQADAPRTNESFKAFFSFKQIYGWMFLLIGGIGTALFIWGLHR